MTEMIIGGRISEDDTSRLARNDDRYRTLRVDRSTHALVGITYEHHEAHDGVHYTAYKSATLQAAQTASISVVAPAGTVPGPNNEGERIHIIFSANTSNQATFTVTEGGVLAGGTAFTPLNSRRNRQGVAGYISGATVATGNTGATPITMAGGDIIFQQVLTTGNQQGGILTRGSEFILKPVTSYLFQILSAANGNAVSILLEWYEHTNLP
jgi:hypothetical protein